MKILAVETATAWQSVAILDDTTVLGRADEEAGGSHAKRLVPAIDGLLIRCELALTDLNGLAVSIGPGSFTGLRVGLATLLGFRMVTGLPLAAVPTLEAMAWNLRGAEWPICPVLRARTGEVYWAQYQWLAGGELKHVQEEQVGTLEQMVQSLKGPALMVGPGWQEFRNILESLLTAQAVEMVEAPADAMKPSAVSVGLAGLQRLKRGDVAGQGLAPHYVQRAEAELVWERRGAVPPAPLRKGRPKRRQIHA